MSCSNSSICCSSELTSQMLLFASIPKYQGPCTFKRNFVQFSKDYLVKRQLWYIITSDQRLSITFFDFLLHISVAHLRRFLSYQRFALSSTTFSIKKRYPDIFYRIPYIIRKMIVRAPQKCWNFRKIKMPPKMATLSHNYGRNVGNKRTSRIDGASVNNMTKRSMPIPSPPVGGMPYSNAST